MGIPAGKLRSTKSRGFRRGITFSGVGAAALALVAGFISLPILALIARTVSGGSWRAMTSPVALEALLVSIRTTSVTMAVILLVGTPAAYVLARSRFPGKRLLDTLIDIPAVLPPSAAGLALLLAFGQMGLLGEHLLVFGIRLPYTTVAVILSQLFVASHFYVRQAATGFSRVERAVEEAALVDGARHFTAFLRVTLPLAYPALLAGAVTAWARALGEFGATIIFAGNLQGVTQTMPLAIYASFESDLDAAVAMAVLVLGFSFVVILTARLLSRKVHERSQD